MAKRQFDGSVDVDSIISNKYCKQTMYTDSVNERSFREYAKTKGYETQLEDLTKEQVDSILCSYFVSVRKVNGEKYQKQSLDGMRFSMNRIFAKMHGPGKFDINSDNEFANFRDTYNAYCKTLKAEGKHIVSHYESIPPETLKTMLHSLNQDTTVQLQLILWIYIMIYFCRRGMENIEKMTKSIFVVMTNASKRRFVVQAIDEETKNHKDSSESSIKHV
jgi:hypothetical protein